MVFNAYPDTPLAEEYTGGDTLAIHRQMKVAYDHDPAEQQTAALL